MPAPVDDEVHAPYILDLWAIPAMTKSRRSTWSPLLGWNGDAPDLHILEGICSNYGNVD